jgi:hypothetical protein
MGMMAAGFVTAAGSTTLPLCALVGGTTGRLHIRMIGVWNTTATACSLVLARLSTAGTPGTSATSRMLDGSDVQAAIGVLKNTYTSTAPTTTELGIGFTLGAAVGSGVILPFEHGELTVPPTAAAAIGILVDTGSTGQACRVFFKWQES